VHLLPQSADATDLVLPSKLSGMLASGRPVITLSESGTELHAVVSQCGLVVAPGDMQALAAAIVRLADDRAARVELGQRARTYAEHHFGIDLVLDRVFGAGAGESSIEEPESVAAPAAP
jgi:colanic acid biosynthesis glycosyl transferase WcaI